jgi:hypothetical protein
MQDMLHTSILVSSLDGDKFFVPVDIYSLYILQSNYYMYKPMCPYFYVNIYHRQVPVFPKCQ